MGDTGVQVELGTISLIIIIHPSRGTDRSRRVNSSHIIIGAAGRRHVIITNGEVNPAPVPRTTVDDGHQVFVLHDTTTATTATTGHGHGVFVFICREGNSTRC